MPKIAVTCPQCDGNELDPVYRRFTSPDNPNGKMLRLDCVFYCPNCVCMVVFPFEDSQMGKRLNKPVIIPKEKVSKIRPEDRKLELNRLKRKFLSSRLRR